MFVVKEFDRDRPANWHLSLISLVSRSGIERAEKVVLGPNQRTTSSEEERKTGEKSIVISFMEIQNQREGHAVLLFWALLHISPFCLPSRRLEDCQTPLSASRCHKFPSCSNYSSRRKLLPRKVPFVAQPRFADTAKLVPVCGVRCWYCNRR